MGLWAEWPWVHLLVTRPPRGAVASYASPRVHTQAWEQPWVLFQEPTVVGGDVGGSRETFYINGDPVIYGNTYPQLVIYSLKF
jgi:hypothetical protein